MGAIRVELNNNILIMKRNKKVLLIILSILFLPIILYIIIDWKNLYIDTYNFRQLNKAKPILESISEEDKIFYSLKEFNKIYETDIKPINNCYYVINRSNWNYKYIFWFKLESKIYNIKYWTGYYAFPAYNLPIDIDCIWWMWTWRGGGCVDWVKKNFIKTISNPCKD